MDFGYGVQAALAPARPDGFGLTLNLLKPSSGAVSAGHRAESADNCSWLAGKKTKLSGAKGNDKIGWE